MYGFTFVQTAEGAVNVIELLAQVLAVGVSAGAIYKGTDLICYALWVFFGKVAPGRFKAAVALTLALLVPTMIYVVLLVDGGLVRYDYRGLVGVVFGSFTLAWAVYQRSKYRARAGEVMETEGGEDRAA